MNGAIGGYPVKAAALVNGILVPLLLVFGVASLSELLVLGVLVGALAAGATVIARRRGGDDDRRPSAYPETLTHPSQDRS